MSQTVLLETGGQTEARGRPFPLQPAALMDVLVPQHLLVVGDTLVVHAIGTSPWRVNENGELTAFNTFYLLSPRTGTIFVTRVIFTYPTGRFYPPNRERR